MQPFGDRSKVVIEPMLTDQWFVDTAKIVGPALDAVRDGRMSRSCPSSTARSISTGWKTSSPGASRASSGGGTRSRSGTGSTSPRHGFRDDEGDGALDEVEMLRLAERADLLEGEDHHHCAADFDAVRAVHGRDRPCPRRSTTPAWSKSPTATRPRTRCAESLAQYEIDQDPTKLVYPVWRDPDVLDTWFSSGLWPIGTLGWPEDTTALKRYFPTSVLITGFDIIFFWVARMMMMQYAVVGEVPFRHRLCARARARREGQEDVQVASATCSTRWS
jgi:valyl-tRNA synthetase